MSDALLGFKFFNIFVTISRVVCFIENGGGSGGGGGGGEGGGSGDDRVGMVLLVLIPTVVKWSFSVLAISSGSV